jgi:hypothetical protein
MAMVEGMISAHLVGATPGVKHLLLQHMVQRLGVVDIFARALAALRGSHGPTRRAFRRLPVHRRQSRRLAA